MADFNAVATAFVNFYYQTFDNSRQELKPLYRDQSMLSFEGSHFAGADKIVEKLTRLPFQRIGHAINTIDAQPGLPGSGTIVVTVTGRLQFDDEPNPQMFSQTFTLVPEGTSYWVYNDIFRLNYG